MSFFNDNELTFTEEEAGLGRLDLRVKDRRNRRVLLLEFKRSATEKDLDWDCDEAIAQIKAMGYNRLMPEGYEEQKIYGIAFHAKTAKIKQMR